MNSCWRLSQWMGLVKHLSTDRLAVGNWSGARDMRAQRIWEETRRSVMSER